MRAAVFDVYGAPEVLAFEDVDMPDVADDEVLVAVAAASVNPGDWDVLRGSPYILRPTTGFRKPRNKILGLAIAGRVEAVLLPKASRYLQLATGPTSLEPSSSLASPPRSGRSFSQGATR